MSKDSDEYELEVMNLLLWPRMQYHILYKPPRTCGGEDEGLVVVNRKQQQTAEQ